MNKDLIIALLALAFAGAAAALLVTLAKLQEEKGRRWDETSRALSIEKELERSRFCCACAEDAAMHQQEERTKLWLENIELQDRLSALRCPRNDHIWIGGVCKRCGRHQCKS